MTVEYTGNRESKKCLTMGSSDVMGKAQKVLEGYSSGSAPDNRHAIKTVEEEPEGFESLGRVNKELTASEDSCAPKRKNISSNTDDDRFGVPVQAFSMSKMSHSKRRKLETRLKDELKQVRALQRKISSLSSNAMILSPTNDIHSHGDGPKRPAPMETFPMYMNKVAAPPGKKKFPLGRNGPCTKGGTMDVTQILPKNAKPTMLIKQCKTLLNQLMTHQHAWIFNTPVDIVKFNIPDYFNVIKHPMDLGTIKRKLLRGQYQCPMRFAADVRLTFKNAMTYNPRGSGVYLMADTMNNFFEMRWKPIEKKIPVKIDESVPSKSSVIIESETGFSLPPVKEQKASAIKHKVKQDPVKLVMSDVEKKKLGADLEALLEELPESIIDFLKESCLNGSQVSEGEIEIDIDTLSDDTLFKLRKLLDNFALEKKNQAKVEPCAIETCNESRFRKMSMQPFEENQPADMDVDICGNDPPISSFPSVARRNSKCSSSNSFSRESGSSSSDSDSGSSSGDKSDGVKDSAPANKMLNCRQEGESASPDRQVSPQKLYRAALLRSRFADIIIKAQENSLERGKNQDPEKLKLNREELERRRREEKARLQAEAKAAEDARIKAEAEAATEAKKKIELEREAARQALQKMEKTVEINENIQFTEDFEIFRAAPDENSQGTIEQTNPECSENGLGSLKFQATGNPLEQLGLYIKEEDDEEEEAVKYRSNPSTSIDMEDGEID
ncbi:unnamed protein product [Fraxinus pennsylvanica]|uniref:Uncharacterized protein n=1 Tax=Fraxinus pennsylvanica TaxID=56036 RepID=A0AAD2AG17_9LAMI|nr:unnamed protein product [Fraxinus pennsylvanica]